MVLDKITSFFKLMAYGIFVWLNLDKEAFGILIILMCLDSVVGAVKATTFGERFKFRTLLWGFCLKLCFLIIPLVVALLGKSLEYDFSVSVNVVISVLSVSEAYSIFGNLYAAKNKTELKKIDFISMLLKSLRTALENTLERITTEIESRGDCELKKKQYEKI